MPVIKYTPTRNKVYTLRQIFTELSLLDCPALRFLHETQIVALQHSHITGADLLSIPGLAETEWVFQRTTDEWIPLFLYLGPERDILKFVSVEPSVDDPFGEDSWWATPKFFYREQYHLAY